MRGGRKLAMQQASWRLLRIAAGNDLHVKQKPQQISVCVKGTQVSTRAELHTHRRAPRHPRDCGRAGTRASVKRARRTRPMPPDSSRRRHQQPSRNASATRYLHSKHIIGTTGKPLYQSTHCAQTKVHGSSHTAHCRGQSKAPPPPPLPLQQTSV